MERLLQIFEEFYDMFPGSPMNVIAGLSEMLHSGLDIECDRSTESGLYEARVLFKLGDENWQQQQYPSFTCQSENMIEAIKGASRQAYEYLAGQLVPPRVVDEDGPRDPEPRGQVQDRNGEKSAVMPFAGQKPKRAAPGSRLFFLSSQLISLLNQYNSVYHESKSRHEIADEVINLMPGAFVFSEPKPTTGGRPGYHRASVRPYELATFFGCDKNPIKATKAAKYNLFHYLHTLSRFFAFFKMAKTPKCDPEELLRKLLEWDSHNNHHCSHPQGPLLRHLVYPPNPRQGMQYFKVSFIIDCLVNVHHEAASEPFARQQAAMKAVLAISDLEPAVIGSLNMSPMVVLGSAMYYQQQQQAKQLGGGQKEQQKPQQEQQTKKEEQKSIVAVSSIFSKPLGRSIAAAKPRSASIDNSRSRAVVPAMLSFVDERPQTLATTSMTRTEERKAELRREIALPALPPPRPPPPPPSSSSTSSGDAHYYGGYYCDYSDDSSLCSTTFPEADLSATPLWSPLDPEKKKKDDEIRWDATPDISTPIESSLKQKKKKKKEVVEEQQKDVEFNWSAKPARLNSSGSEVKTKEEDEKKKIITTTTSSTTQERKEVLKTPSPSFIPNFINRSEPSKQQQQPQHRPGTPLKGPKIGSGTHLLNSRDERLLKLLNLFGSVYLPAKSKMGVMKELLVKGNGSAGRNIEEDSSSGDLLKIQTTISGSERRPRFLTTIDSEDLGRFFGAAACAEEARQQALEAVYDVLRRLTAFLVDFVELSSAAIISSSSSSSLSSSSAPEDQQQQQEKQQNALTSVELFSLLLAKHPATASLQIWRKSEGGPKGGGGGCSASLGRGKGPYQGALVIAHLHYFNEAAPAGEQVMAVLCGKAGAYLRQLTGRLARKVPVAAVPLPPPKKTTSKQKSFSNSSPSSCTGSSEIYASNRERIALVNAFSAAHRPGAFPVDVVSAMLANSGSSSGGGGAQGRSLVELSCSRVTPGNYHRAVLRLAKQPEIVAKCPRSAVNAREKAMVAAYRLLNNMAYLFQVFQRVWSPGKPSLTVVRELIARLPATSEAVVLRRDGSKTAVTIRHFTALVAYDEDPSRAEVVAAAKAVDYLRTMAGWIQPPLYELKYLD